jgi:CubicO group peptidase (beta-lactamase class C family)
MGRVADGELHGRPNGQSILSRDWVREATSPSYAFTSAAPPLQDASYGWLWWLTQTRRNAFFAWGHGGQFVWVVPDRQLVVVVTTDWRSPPVTPAELAANGMDLILNWVLPAVSR